MSEDFWRGLFACLTMVFTGVCVVSALIGKWPWEGLIVIVKKEKE
jgi:hypothetical protein